MIDFDEAWETLPMGSRVRVADGRPEPEPPSGLRWNAWRSHNHEGEVVDKVLGPPRGIQVRLDKIDGAQVTYTIADGSEDQFEVL
jgi:hypothetical protein